MAISAIVLIVLGICLIGYGALSFQNVGDMPFME